jgi:hypothetical protein
LNNDAYLEILYKSNLDTIKELCNTDKHMKELCKTHGNSIIKNLLKNSGFNYFKGFEGDYVIVFKEMLKYLKNNKERSFEYFLDYGIYHTILTSFSDITREFLQKNIKNYDVSNLKLNVFPTHYFCNVRRLICVKNSLTSLPDPKYFPNLEELVCNDNVITEIPNYKKLVLLNCWSNRLTNIPILPKLEYLYCDFNNIRKIENYPKLKTLNCHHNNISKIEYSSELVDIDCGNNNLTDLPKDLLKLRMLSCFNNHLTEIHYYPQLEDLNCQENNLHELYSNNLPKLKNLIINEDVHIKLEDFTNLEFVNGTSVREIDYDDNSI